MSVILLDGCEDFSSWVPYGTASALATGRNGNGWTIPGAFATSGHTFSIPAAEQTDTLTIGFAFTTGSLSILPTFEFTSDNGAIIHDRVSVRNTGIEVQRGGSTTIYNQPYGLFAINTWFYIEVTVVLHDTAGSITARVNGTSLGTLTGLDTKNGGSKAVFDTVNAKGIGSSLCVLDDLYLTNDVNFLGDVKIETLYPNGNGVTNQFVGSDGNSTDNYLLVDEAGAPVITDYTQSSTAGQRDLYTMTDLVATSGSVRAVCPATHAFKTDGGTRQVKLAVRGSAVNVSPARDLSTSPVNQHYVFTTNPETGAAWTIAEVNALQTGVEVV